MVYVDQFVTTSTIQSTFYFIALGAHISEISFCLSYVLKYSAPVNNLTKLYLINHLLNWQKNLISAYLAVTYIFWNYMKLSHIACNKHAITADSLRLIKLSFWMLIIKFKCWFITTKIKKALCFFLHYKASNLKDTCLKLYKLKTSTVTAIFYSKHTSNTWISK